MRCDVLGGVTVACTVLWQPVPVKEAVCRVYRIRGIPYKGDTGYAGHTGYGYSSVHWRDVFSDQEETLLNRSDE